MDLREKKTKRSITNAFLSLRARKPLERITIRELSELAEISKATFYLHYKDIYDLSEQLEKEVIQTVMNSLSEPDLFLSDLARSSCELAAAFCAQQNIIQLLFSGSRAHILPAQIESEIRERLYVLRPDLREDEFFNVQLTFHIQGGYYAYTRNRQLFGDAKALEALRSVYMRYQW